MNEETSGYQFIGPLVPCPYLPKQIAQLHYELKSSLDAEEYLGYLNEGWRRFGGTLFHPVCPSCRSCQPIRVLVDEFIPSRSQRRVIKANSGIVQLKIGLPVLDSTRYDLYMDHHLYHSQTRGWPKPNSSEALASIREFIEDPLSVEEWAYYVEDKLVAVCYVDVLSNGFSGIYFYYSPEYRRQSLGNWMCLSMIIRAAELKLPYLYLGYYVQGSISMEYKARFKPNQILSSAGDWEDFKRT